MPKFVNIPQIQAGIESAAIIGVTHECGLFYNSNLRFPNTPAEEFMVEQHFEMLVRTILLLDNSHPSTKALAATINSTDFVHGKGNQPSEVVYQTFINDDFIEEYTQPLEESFVFRNNFAAKDNSKVLLNITNFFNYLTLEELVAENRNKIGTIMALNTHSSPVGADEDFEEESSNSNSVDTGSKLLTEIPEKEIEAHLRRVSRLKKWFNTRQALVLNSDDAENSFLHFTSGSENPSSLSASEVGKYLSNFASLGEFAYVDTVNLVVNDYVRKTLVQLDI